ncbi:type IX secretion system membrane protein PorP/SprF [Autumnicola musiva]|uniref:type IX secretion system membrane protein PorP/SprF n=1 Tax=Autumnicola musiva TaxID=3075589 RepID=UPI003D77100F
MLYDRLSFGLGYRYNESISGMAGFQVFNGFLVGYSYDFAINEFGNYHNGSHETVIKFKFNKNNFGYQKALNSF